MKYLNQFLKFNWDEFSKGKRFLIVGRKDWIDYDTKEFLGTKLDVAIFQDSTNYEYKDGEVGSNLYERFIVKISDNIDVPMNVEIRLKNVEANVYGDYRNLLSVVAEEVVIVSRKDA